MPEKPAPGAQAPPADLNISADDGAALTAFPLSYYQVQYRGVAALNTELERFILELEASDRQRQRASMRGGYHSETDFLTLQNWAVASLVGMIQQTCKSYIPHMWQAATPVPLASVGEMSLAFYGWAMLMRAGDMSAPHVHPGSHISGAYYVAMPPAASDAADQGEFVMMDPRPRAPLFPVKGQTPALRLAPTAGMMLLFPSWEEHYVAPFHGSGLRISIAFNITLPENAKP